MGFFGRSAAEGSVTPARRANATTTPLLHASSSSSPVSPPRLTEEQEAQYASLLAYLRSPEHGIQFTDQEQIYLSRDQMLRFCRATKWDLSKTKTRIMATLRWRREYGVDRITAEHVQPEATTGKQVIFGFDNAQRPCLYLFPGRQNTDVSPRQVQYLVWSLERIIELMPIGVENIALLVNYKGSTGDKNPGIGQGREVLNILQTHYVETLGRALVINIPFFVWGFFKLITPFIDPLTREKLKFNEDMTLHVPPSQLDTEFGGEVVFDYVQEDYWPALLKMTQEARTRRMDNWRAAGGGIGISEAVLKRAQTQDASATDSAPTQRSPATTTNAHPSETQTSHESLLSSGPAGRLPDSRQQPIGTTLVSQANAENISDEPVQAVYVPGTQAGPQLAQHGRDLH